MTATSLGVQLGINGYGIFGPLPERDIDAALALVAGTPCTGVEIMTNLLGDPDRLVRACREHGREIVAVHVFWPELDDELHAAVRRLGIPRIICSGLPGCRSEDWAATVPALMAAATRAREAGAELMVHNHAEECLPYAGHPTALDFLAAHTDPDRLSFVVDLFWATRGGCDVPALLRRLGDRCDYVHLKDGPRWPGADDRSYGLGDGDVDLAAAWADTGAVRWAVIERDLPPADLADGLRRDVSAARRLLDSRAPASDDVAAAR